MNILFLSLLTLHGACTASKGAELKANQIHAKIDEMMARLQPLLPEQSGSAVINIDEIKKEEHKPFSLAEMQSFLMNLGAATKHLKQLEGEHAQQTRSFAGHQKKIEQLLKIAEWFAQPKSKEAWKEYINLHPKILATVKEIVVLLAPNSTLNDACTKAGQCIINALGILIAQLSMPKEDKNLLVFFAAAYRDFIKVFKQYPIETHPKIDAIAAGR